MEVCKVNNLLVMPNFLGEEENSLDENFICGLKKLLFWTAQLHAKRSEIKKAYTTSCPWMTDGSLNSVYQWRIQMKEPWQELGYVYLDRQGNMHFMVSLQSFAFIDVGEGQPEKIEGRVYKKNGEEIDLRELESDERYCVSVEDILSDTDNTPVALKTVVKIINKMISCFNDSKGYCQYLSAFLMVDSKLTIGDNSMFWDNFFYNPNQVMTSSQKSVKDQLGEGSDLLALALGIENEPMCGNITLYCQ